MGQWNHINEMLNNTDPIDTTAIKELDLPEEIFLDQTQTSFVQSFVFSAATYPGATNPNLDGKPVLVLAVKGDNYSFVNLENIEDELEEMEIYDDEDIWDDQDFGDDDDFDDDAD